MSNGEAEASPANPTISFGSNKTFVEASIALPTVTLNIKKMSVIQITDLLLREEIFKTMDDDESIYCYGTLGKYVNGERILKQFCANNDGINTPNKFNQIKLNVTGRTYNSRDKFIPPDGYLNLKNGVLKIDTGELLPRDPQYNFLQVSNICYDPDAKCPKFDEFLSEVLIGSQKELLQKWFGYHFWKGQPLKKAMFLVGVSDGGKTTTLKLLNELLGKENYANFQMNDFNNPATHAIPSLYGKLANIYADMGTKELRDVGKFKMLTSSDSISARYHYHEPFSFVNSAKMTFSCNKTPKLIGEVASDEAFWNRILIIPFVKQIPKDKQNPNLCEEIINEEMSGILNWALYGYKVVREKGFDFPIDFAKKVWFDWMYNPDEKFDV